MSAAFEGTLCPLSFNRAWFQGPPFTRYFMNTHAASQLYGADELLHEWVHPISKEMGTSPVLWLGVPTVIDETVTSVHSPRCAVRRAQSIHNRSATQRSTFIGSS
jgi:hypothetical protein